MRLRMTGAKPGIGVKALDQVAKRTMLDHQNSCVCHASPPHYATDAPILAQMTVVLALL